MGDSSSKFTAGGRTPQENEAYDYIKNLAHFRMNASALKTGKLMQYVPADGIYIYFRYDEKETVMCVMNTAATEKQVDFKDFAERTGGFTGAKEITTGKTLGTQFSIPAKTFWVLDLSK